MFTKPPQAESCKLRMILMNRWEMYNYLKTISRILCTARKEIEKLTKQKALDILKSIYGVKTTLPVSNKTIEIVMANTKEQKELLSAFNIEF